MNLVALFVVPLLVAAILYVVNFKSKVPSSDGGRFFLNMCTVACGTYLTLQAAGIAPFSS